MKLSSILKWEIPFAKSASLQGIDKLILALSLNYSLSYYNQTPILREVGSPQCWISNWCETGYTCKYWSPWPFGRQHFGYQWCSISVSYHNRPLSIWRLIVLWVLRARTICSYFSFRRNIAKNEILIKNNKNSQTGRSNEAHQDNNVHDHDFQVTWYHSHPSAKRSSTTELVPDVKLAVWYTVIPAMYR